MILLNNGFENTILLKGNLAKSYYGLLLGAPYEL
jgi:hypothetical protein